LECAPDADIPLPKAFLKLAGVEFRTVSSNNHASPTGALPFLIPPSTPSDPDSQVPVTSGRLETYALDHGSDRVPEVSGLRVEAYQSLLDHAIRNAWLYALYLSPANAELLAALYINPTSATAIVRAATALQLRRAAEAQILQSVGAPKVDAVALYKNAEQAFGALEAAMEFDSWFFGNSGPGLFDAAVFSYTHLLLDESLGWTDKRLSDALRRFPKLVDHRNRLLDRCWP
jgi:metaxin